MKKNGLYSWLISKLGMTGKTKQEKSWNNFCSENKFEIVKSVPTPEPTVQECPTSRRRMKKLRKSIDETVETGGNKGSQATFCKLC